MHPLFLLYRRNFSGGKLMSLSVMLQQLASGMVVSVEIFVVTLLFSLPLGLLICFGRMSKNPAIRGIVSAYISVMRGTPLMLQLMVVYFGPYFIFGIRISMGYSLIAVFIAFSINYAAYFAEIYRGGIESISVGTVCRLQRSWDTAKPRHFSGSSCRR